ncbi:MAG: LemA family protein [Candidatus Eisenbacteria bacterium]|nr:LemA family protein [Candidatus Eisenbacteria bacterium]
MKKGLVVLLVLVGLFVLVGGWLSGQYNGLVSSQEGVNQAWAQVENVYQRRADLIPNLVETVKGAAAFEQETFIAVAEARARVGSIQLTPEMLKDPEALKNFEAAQGQMTSALSRLLAVAENYPQLKANQNFLDLQSQLEGTENRITVERRTFNQVAQTYNTKIRIFPTSLLAGMFGFAPRPYFASAPGSDKAPAVKF